MFFFFFTLFQCRYFSVVKYFVCFITWLQMLSFSALVWSQYEESRTIALTETQFPIFSVVRTFHELIWKWLGQQNLEGGYHESINLHQSERFGNELPVTNTTADKVSDYNGINYYFSLNPFQTNLFRAKTLFVKKSIKKSLTISHVPFLFSKLQLYSRSMAILIVKQAQ